MKKRRNHAKIDRHLQLVTSVSAAAQLMKSTFDTQKFVFYIVYILSLVFIQPLLRKKMFPTLAKMSEIVAGRGST